LIFLSSLIFRAAGPLLDSGAGGCPAASNFLLLRQKKVTKEKATRSLGPSASLRATCGARAKRGLAKLATLRFAQTTRSLIRLSLRSSAQPGRGNRDRERGQIQTRTRHGVSLWFSVFGVLSSAVGYSVFLPPPLVYAPRSGGSGGSGIALSERSEFSETPPEPSTAGCPQRSGGTQTPGSPFLLLTFGVRVTSLREVSEPRARSAPFGEQKKTRFAGFAKSELPPGNPRPAELRRAHSAGAGKASTSSARTAITGLRYLSPNGDGQGPTSKGGGGTTP